MNGDDKRTDPTASMSDDALTEILTTIDGEIFHFAGLEDELQTKAAEEPIIPDATISQPDLGGFVTKTDVYIGKGSTRGLTKKLDVYQGQGATRGLAGLSGDASPTFPPPSESWGGQGDKRGL